MSTIATVVVSACMSLSGPSQEACSKALEAGARQSGIEQNLSQFEKRVERQADAKGHYYLGDTGMEMVGSSMFVAKTLIDKSATFNTPTFGLCDRVTNTIGPSKYNLMLEWRF